MLVDFDCMCVCVCVTCKLQLPKIMLVDCVCMYVTCQLHCLNASQLYCVCDMSVTKMLVDFNYLYLKTLCVCGMMSVTAVCSYTGRVCVYIILFRTLGLYDLTPAVHTRRVASR